MIETFSNGHRLDRSSKQHREDLADSRDQNFTPLQGFGEERI